MRRESTSGVESGFGGLFPREVDWRETIEVTEASEI